MKFPELFFPSWRTFGKTRKTHRAPKNLSERSLTWMKFGLKNGQKHDLTEGFFFAVI